MSRAVLVDRLTFAALAFAAAGVVCLVRGEVALGVPCGVAALGLVNVAERLERGNR